MEKPKAYFIDIDGTLMEGTKKLNIDDEQAIKNVAKEGSYVILSTGRSIQTVWPVWEQIRLKNKYTRYVVCNNGSAIWDMEAKKILDEHFLDKDTFTELSKYLYNKGYAIRNSLESKFYSKKSIVSSILKLKKNFKVENDFSKFEYNKDTSRKMGAITSYSKRKVKKNASIIKKKFPQLEISITGPGLYIEMNAEGISKGVGAKFLSEKLGFNLEEAVHIGDSMNDLAGFKAVGIGVAMGNGMKQLKKEADFITLSLKKSGVSCAINELSQKELKIKPSDRLKKIKL